MPWLLGSSVPANGFQTVLRYVAAVAKESMVGPAHYVGHDLGGVALYWLAQTGFCAEMKSMTIIAAPHPFAYRRFFASAEAAPRVRYIDGILESRDDAALQRDLLDRVVGGDVAVTDEIKAALDATDFASLRTLYAQIRQSGLQSAPQVGAKADFKVALIHAEEDRYLPAWVMEESAQSFGASETTLRLDGDSHYPHLTEAAKVADFAERFWNAVES